jgi:hypothetical protein
MCSYENYPNITNDHYQDVEHYQPTSVTNNCANKCSTIIAITIHYIIISLYSLGKGLHDYSYDENWDDGNDVTIYMRCFHDLFLARSISQDFMTRKFMAKIMHPFMGFTKKSTSDFWDEPKFIWLVVYLPL